MTVQVPQPQLWSSVNDDNDRFTVQLFDSHGADGSVGVDRVAEQGAGVRIAGEQGKSADRDHQNGNSQSCHGNSQSCVRLDPDALAFAGPGWQENDRLLEDVSRLTSAPGWVFDSLGYPRVRDVLWSRADTIVWLDFSRAVVMRRVLRRSAARTLLRRRIFGGNVETLASWFQP